MVLNFKKILILTIVSNVSLIKCNDKIKQLKNAIYWAETKVARLWGEGRCDSDFSTDYLPAIKKLDELKLELEKALKEEIK